MIAACTFAPRNGGRPRWRWLASTALVATLLTTGASGAERTVTIVVRDDALLVNGEQTESIEDLRRVLRPYERPTVIVSGHVCADSGRVTEVVEMIKASGYRSVVLEAFGLFQDAECELPAKRRWWRRNED